MLMEGQLPLITAADIARADESRVRLAVGAGDLRPIADDRDVVGELECVAVRHREVAPVIAGGGRGRDVLGRMDAVHLARLWESEQAASVPSARRSDRSRRARSLARSRRARLERTYCLAVLRGVFRDSASRGQFVPF